MKVNSTPWCVYCVLGKGSQPTFSRSSTQAAQENISLSFHKETQVSQPEMQV
jgi:hypothetical protein